MGEQVGGDALRTQSFEYHVDGAEGGAPVAEILPQEITGGVTKVALLEEKAVPAVGTGRHVPPAFNFITK